MDRLRHAFRGVAAAALLGWGVSAARPPVAEPLAVRHGADQRFAVLEHAYVTYLLGQFPVVATYLGGDAFDPLAG